jgi:hypothetical protein
LPKLIMPRQMRDTRRPVAPKFTYCIGCLLASWRRVIARPLADARMIGG